jgi:hypothetical protein
MRDLLKRKVALQKELRRTERIVLLPACRKERREAVPGRPLTKTRRPAYLALCPTTTSLIWITGVRSVYFGMSAMISLACGPKPA